MLQRIAGILIALVGVALTLAGCADLAYYRQAAVGQWEHTTFAGAGIVEIP